MDKHVKKGIMFGAASYVIWGLLPIYWKALDTVSSGAVFSHRILWSAVFMLLYIIITKRFTPFVIEVKRIFTHYKIWFSVLLASCFIGINWLVFIWAVQSNYVIQASLGYYINPLMSVLLGVVVLKERLAGLQRLSVLLAATGVIYLTVSYNVFPWISLILAASFATYGLFKKMANLDATFSLMIETAILTPFALGYLFFRFGLSIGFQQHLTTDSLLVISGIATAVPLLLFGIAVLHIPLSLTGFLQYIAPTLMLLIGVILYGETFTKDHFITFLFIWASVILYVTSTLQQRKRRAIEQ